MNQNWRYVGTGKAMPPSRMWLWVWLGVPHLIFKSASYPTKIIVLYRLKLSPMSLKARCVQVLCKLMKRIGVNIPLLSEMDLECSTTSHHSTLMKLSTIPSVDEEDEVSSYDCIASYRCIHIILILSFRIFLAGTTMNTWSTERNCLKINITCIF